MCSTDLICSAWSGKSALAFSPMMFDRSASAVFWAMNVQHRATGSRSGVVSRTPSYRYLPSDSHILVTGSSTSANLTIQLAKLAGLKTIAIVDKARHGLRLANHKNIRTDLLVDSHDPKRAVDIIRANVNGKLRFGIDTRGRDSATSLLQALSPGNLGSSATDGRGSLPPSPPASPHGSTQLSAHLIGLTGLPKQSPPEGALFHTVPIKLFHEVPAVGSALVQWLERLLEKGLVSPPEIIDVEQGLGNVNKGLDRMRRGEIRGGKLVVKLE